MMSFLSLRTSRIAGNAAGPIFRSAELASFPTESSASLSAAMSLGKPSLASKPSSFLSPIMVTTGEPAGALMVSNDRPALVNASWARSHSVNLDHGPGLDPLDALNDV